MQCPRCKHHKCVKMPIDSIFGTSAIFSVTLGAVMIFLGIFLGFFVMFFGFAFFICGGIFQIIAQALPHEQKYKCKRCSHVFVA